MKIVRVPTVSQSLLRRSLSLIACGSFALFTGCLAVGCLEQTALAAEPPQRATAPVLQAAAAPPSQQPSTTPKPPQEDTAQTRRIQQLIANVEKTYQNGVQNYSNGRFDAARLDFDYAVDQMLTSGMDLKSEGPLADEFERIVNAVNALEIDALKQGNGFSPKLEESPIEAAGELTFPSNPELTAQISAELKTTQSQSDFPLVVNDYVAGWISNFQNNPGSHAHLVRSLERAGKYKEMILRILKEEGVPQDLIYQAITESGFQPQAFNARSGAGGMWQFMPFASAYGLVRNGYVDERFDPEKSTHAYGRYMKLLYAQLGDWYLAMAAYDWGAGNVQRAVMRTGYADYWSLYRKNALPKETMNYIPGVIASIIMAHNPQQYGLDHMTPEPAVVYDTVNISYSLDLRLVADITNTTLANIVGLNPSLLRLATPRDTSVDLHIPSGTKDQFLKRVAAIPEDKRASWRFHEVQANESLDQVAQLFHVKSHDLRVANDLDEDDPVEAGDELIVPVVTSSASGAHPQRYTVRRGDTLVTVADRFGTTVEDLRRWNNLRASSVGTGRSLYVSEPVHLGPTTHIRGRGRGRAARGARRGKAASTAGKTTGSKHSSSHTSTAKKSSAGASSHHAKTKKRR